MEQKVTYLILTAEGKYRKTSDQAEADYVRIPVGQYISLEEWNNLVEKYKDLKRQYENSIQNKRVDSDDEDVVVMPREEYNGIQKMFRILRDRSLQEIDKSKADTHGYSLKYADERIYDKVHSQQKAYAITKLTPVSLRIDLETAFFMIKNDLKEYYNYIDDLTCEASANGSSTDIKIPDLIAAIAQRDDPDYTHDFYLDNSDHGRYVKEFLDKQKNVVSFGPIKIWANFGQGVYEISYWASGPI